jgi:predicted small lipoprotein YifL
MRGFCFTLSLLLLVACGQKGGLYLPEKKPPVGQNFSHSQP